ncbi:MAG TPA: hypothetical protein G4N95_04325 [Anaerolineae bacterium]|nr:hypothetical protein [Anaerolineae bacterium]
MEEKLDSENNDQTPNESQPKPEETLPTEPLQDNVVAETPKTEDKAESGQDIEEITAKEESRARHIFRIAIRIITGLLIVFGLGFLTATFLFYKPTLNQLNQTKNEMAKAQDTISSLNTQIDELEAESLKLQRDLDAQQALNQELQSKVSQKDLLVSILTARVYINQSYVSLVKNNINDSLASLNKTKDLLKTIENDIKLDQQNDLETIMQRLDLIITEIKTDTYAAQSDIDVLLTNLSQLEMSLFPEK